MPIRFPWLTLYMYIALLYHKPAYDPYEPTSHTTAPNDGVLQLHCYQTSNTSMKTKLSTLLREILDFITEIA